MNEWDRQSRLAVSKACDDYGRGRLCRRDFLQLCAMAGFGFSSPHFLLGKNNGAISTKTSGLPSNWADSLSSPAQQAFLKDVGKHFRGTRLRIVTEDTPPSRATKAIMEKEFIPLTGIEVEWDQFSLDKVLSKVTADTSRQIGRHDIFYLDQAWIGRFCDDMVSPLALMDKPDLAYPDYRFDDFLAPLVENAATYQGKLAAIPYDIAIFITMYRKDIFRQLGLQVPKTVHEYLHVVKTVNKAMSPRVYGTTGQWRAGHYGLECHMTMWLWAFGGSIFNADGSCAISDSRAKEAMEFMMELGKYMPPGVTEWDWHGEADSFRSGRSAIYSSWGEFFPSFDDPATSKIVGLAEAAPCPHPIALKKKSDCAFDETPGVSHQGGSSLGISKYSRNIEAAWIFLQWATSAEVTLRACLMGGGASLIRRSSYSHPMTAEKACVATGTTRHMPVTLDAIMNHMGTEPHLPAWPSLSTRFAIELGKMTSGQQSIPATLSNMTLEANKVVPKKRISKR